MCGGGGGGPDKEPRGLRYRHYYRGVLNARITGTDDTRDGPLPRYGLITLFTQPTGPGLVDQLIMTYIRARTRDEYKSTSEIGCAEVKQADCGKNMSRQFIYTGILLGIYTYGVVCARTRYFTRVIAILSVRCVTIDVKIRYDPRSNRLDQGAQIYRGVTPNRG